MARAGSLRRLEWQNLLGPQLPTHERSDTDEPLGGVEDLHPGRVGRFADRLGRAVHESPRGIGRQRDGRQRQQAVDGEDRVGQATLTRKAFELVWTDAVVDEKT